MKHQLRSAVCTEGRKMAGARALWVAAGMKHEQFGKPIIAIVNSFTQFVPGHTHLHEIGQIVKREIEKMGCYAAEFNTIAIDDGIAMGHDGMLYSLPSRDIIADSVEYMVNAHKADAMICISNCDKVTPGMLMAAMRLNIPTVFCSGGPMEAGRWKGENADLITAMIAGADKEVCDAVVAGGVDIASNTVLMGFNSLEAVSAGKITNPFSKNRCGITLGEAAAFFVLTRENLFETGIALLGYGESCDAYHMTSPDPEGKGAALAISEALKRSRLNPSEIDYINLHGTGTRFNDSMEAKAVKKVFGGSSILCSSTKPMTGHTLGAAGALETAVCFESIYMNRGKP